MPSLTGCLAQLHVIWTHLVSLIKPSLTIPSMPLLMVPVTLRPLPPHTQLVEAVESLTPPAAVYIYHRQQFHMPLSRCTIRPVEALQYVTLSSTRILFVLVSQSSLGWVSSLPAGNTSILQELSMEIQQVVLIPLSYSPANGPEVPCICHSL